MEQTRRPIPAARQADLIIQEVPEETLVYDLKNHKAHCLNRTAALVWKHCDGKQTASEVARKVEKELGAPVSTEVVWLAVHQLEKKKLLQEPVERFYGASRVSRREVVRRLGITAAVALPLVTSILAPQAVQAASGCVGLDGRCETTADCCPGLECGDGFCFSPPPP